MLTKLSGVQNSEVLTAFLELRTSHLLTAPLGLEKQLIADHAYRIEEQLLFDKAAAAAAYLKVVGANRHVWFVSVFGEKCRPCREQVCLCVVLSVGC